MAHPKFALVSCVIGGRPSLENRAVVQHVQAKCIFSQTLENRFWNPKGMRMIDQNTVATRGVKTVLSHAWDGKHAVSKTMRIV